MYKLDCVYFLGEKPCKYKRECPGCLNYKPMGKKILIVKFDSIGDVLRTTPILRGLKKKYPNCYITWITKSEALPLLVNNQFINIVVPYGVEALLRILKQDFDLVISLDKTANSTALAELANAKEKVGFGLSPSGNIYPMGKTSEYAFNLGISNDLKFKRNKKTYQEIIFEIAGLKYKGEKYILNLTKEQKSLTERLRRKFKLKKSDKVVSFNTGCGNAFQGKKWTIDGFLKLGSMLNKRLNAKILLLGGKYETKRNEEILKNAEFSVLDTGCDNSLDRFISIVNLCDAIVCGDTMAMHIAIALNKTVIALFGPTVPQEIDLYSKGKKLMASVKCSPCYKKICDKKNLCMRKIKPEGVFKSIKNLLKK